MIVGILSLHNLAALAHFNVSAQVCGGLPCRSADSENWTFASVTTVYAVGPIIWAATRLIIPAPVIRRV